MANSAHSTSTQGQTWSSPIIISDNSGSLAQYAGPLRFQVHLYSDYKRLMVLPELPILAGGTRWILINTEHERTYKVQMVDDGGGFALKRGWSLVAAIENLEEGQTLMFEQQEENIFDMWIHNPPAHPLPIGFSPARNLAQNLHMQPHQLIINPGTTINLAVLQAINKVWQASSDNTPLYVCRLLNSPSDGKCLIFNKAYTSFTPKNNDNIAMRFIGSTIIIPGAMKTYADRNARITKNWCLYAEEHNLTFGKTLVCKVLRGPTTWEFIATCAIQEIPEA